MENVNYTREAQIAQLDKTDNWDVIVIGGGASGLGAALDASLRGYKTVLFELKDYAKGTSSRSTKLVHGGVRYLAQGNISLVKEALRERGLLAKNAAHLVHDLKFVLPNYSVWKGLYYLTGLKMYDLLSGKLSIGKTEFLKKSSVVDKLATIQQKGLKNGVLYHDGQFDDSRLAINIMQSIVEQGGVAVNYMGVSGLLKDEAGILNGVEVTDEFTGQKRQVKAKVVINATGVFTDDILNMNNPDHREVVVPSQGVHLVVDKSFLPGQDAIMIPKTSDGRVLFAVPWHNKVVIGTTDTLMEKESFEPRALDQEIEFILETANTYLAKTLTRDDVLAVYAGLRPLAAPKDHDKNTKEVSRGHKIMVGDSGLITIIGGKWTTYRQMAEDIIDKAMTVGALPAVASQTHNFPIHGNMPKEQVNRKNDLYIYGSDIQYIKRLEHLNPQYTVKIHPRHSATYAQVIWAIQQEMAQTVEDILARRIRFLFTDARAAIDSAKPVAEFMAKELNYSSEWIENQVNEFTKLAQGYLLVPYTAQPLSDIPQTDA